MLNHIKYHVEIVQPAKTLTGNHSFKDGMTGITGPNGKGKSMILEMIQFALFGTEALRGKMDDYKKLESELDFTLNGRNWFVERTKLKAVLTELLPDGSRQINASGTKPVNSKILELFGYSSDVFQVANLCNQGKIEELGNMKPTERKRLVDETIGLNILDDLVVFIDEERKRLSGGIKAIEGMLVAPTEPVDPQVGASSLWSEKRETLQLQLRECSALQALAKRPLTAPVEPSLLKDDAMLPVYEQEMARRSSINTEIHVLAKQLVAIPQPPENMVDKLEEDDGKLEEYQEGIKHFTELTTEFKLVAKNVSYHFPEMTEEEVAQAEALNLAIRRWEDKQALIARRVPHDCPKCHHHWDDEDPRISTEYADVPDARPEGKKTPVSFLEAQKECHRNMKAAKPHEERMAEIREEQKKFDAVALQLNITRIEATRKAFHAAMLERSNAERRTAIQNRLEELRQELALLPDRAADIEAIKEARNAVAQYEIKHQMYLVQKRERDEALEKLKAYPEDLEEQLAYADVAYTSALTYEANLESYQKALVAYNKAMSDLEILKLELEDWTKGREAVADLRVKVKGYLLPSLNAVASRLINEMTGGELSWIVVDDQFNITVEGQRLETLSGAGKAVANLALRIALGQVLTNRVFSVMMLDEIDASCDDDRAKYIAGCLRNLTKSIKQVIQVSHKQGLEADHYVRL